MSEKYRKFMKLKEGEEEEGVSYVCVQKEGKKKFKKNRLVYRFIAIYFFIYNVCRMRTDTCTYFYFSSERPHLN